MTLLQYIMKQVRVPSPDTDALRFLWRKSTDTEIEDYAVRAHIFGKKDSPCAGNWALIQTPPEDDYQLKRIIGDNFYMDDFLYSMNCKLKLNKLCIRLINVLSSHQFNLTKCMSNHPVVWNDIPKEILFRQNVKLDFNSEITEKALGLLCDVKNNKLTFQHSPKSWPNTKGGIFSLVASIFHPFGFVTAAILEVKLIIQSLWKLKIDSDDQQCLNELHYISISRWFSLDVGKKSDVELHIYSDASNSADGAVAATNIFWSRWTREYLPMLTEQKKWSTLNVNLKKGDLVLLCDKNLKRSHWPLGRVVETLPGPDNVFRVVKVQTKGSSYVWDQ